MNLIKTRLYSTQTHKKVSSLFQDHGSCQIFPGLGVVLVYNLMACLFFFSLFRVKKLTKMSEKVATGVLSGVVKVSGFFTSSIVNSKVGKKFFSLLPGEIVLASLDGFSKLFI